jgi:16S rRNA processing protein RimM
MKETGLLCIGKIVGVHGLEGNLKVYSYAESLDVYEPGAQIFVKPPKKNKKEYIVNRAKPHKNIILLSLKGVGRDEAETLVDSELLIEKSNLPELEEDTYYWDDIIGLDVYTTDDEYLGRVDSIIATGSNDVYVVKHNTREILIPALASVVLSIDLGQGVMRVNLPEGL